MAVLAEVADDAAAWNADNVADTAQPGGGGGGGGAGASAGAFNPIDLDVNADGVNDEVFRILG